MDKFRSWLDFVRFTGSVDHRFRYVHTDKTREFLETLVKTSFKRYRVFDTKEVLWRAQLGCANRKRKLGEVVEDHEIVVEHQIPYPASRMKPLQHTAKEGRVNPKGIPALYLTTDIKTAIAEVRPWVGSYVSLGKFKLMRNLKVVDFSKEDNTSLGYYAEEPTSKHRTSIIWAQIGQIFSMLVSDDPSTACYAPTQIIAETFHQQGFDGLVYKSSLGPGLNVAFFSLDAADVVTRSLDQVESVSFCSKKVSSGRRGKPA